MRVNLDNYVKVKNRQTGIDLSLLRAVKRELVAFMHDNDNGYAIHHYYQGFSQFESYIDRLYSYDLSGLDIETIRIMGYVEEIDKFDLQFMMEEL